MQTVVSLGAQAVLILLGLSVILADDEPAANLTLLSSWCLFATVFTIVTLVVLGREAHRKPIDDDEPPALRSAGSRASSR